MKSYTETIQQLRNEKIDPLRGNYYDYHGHALGHEFDRFYTFCQSYLDRKDLNFNIRPARMYYNNIDDINAVARTKGEFSLVELFGGCLPALYEFFVSKSHLFQQVPFSVYSADTLRHDIDAGYFLFQFTTMYVFYHEVGHLIQQSAVPGLSNSLAFLEHDCTGSDVGFNHIRELDADWYSSSCIALHVKQFSEVVQGDAAYLARMTSLALSGIYTYYIYKSHQQQELYYEEHCHPHPSVRLSYLIIFFLDNLAANLPYRLDQRTVLTEAIRISERLLQTSGQNIVETYSKAIYENATTIEAYINQIMRNGRRYPFLCNQLLVDPLFE